jgi:septum formation protein
LKKHNKFLLKANYPIILASQSEIRKKILTDTGLIFKQVSSGLNEKEVKKTFAYKRISNLSKKLAQEKSFLVSKKNYDSYVIGADQICSYKNKILSKPNNKKNAISQLMQINGGEHKQISSVCVCYQEKIVWSYTETVYLKMRKLSLSLIKLYINTDMPLKSCGSYKYEARGKYLFSKVKGSYDAILGLPLSPLLEILYKKKIIEYA